MYLGDTSYADDLTKDIQHDLAMYMADGNMEDTTAIRMQQELQRRNATLPTNARWVYSSYSRFELRIEYELEGIQQ